MQIDKLQSISVTISTPSITPTQKRIMLTQKEAEYLSEQGVEIFMGTTIVNDVKVGYYFCVVDIKQLANIAK
jgi:maleate cis-trans isomerase